MMNVKKVDLKTQHDEHRWKKWDMIKTVYIYINNDKTITVDEKMMNSDSKNMRQKLPNDGIFCKNDEIYSELK